MEELGTLNTDPHRISLQFSLLCSPSKYRSGNRIKHLILSVDTFSGNVFVFSVFVGSTLKTLWFKNNAALLTVSLNKTRPKNNSPPPPHFSDGIRIKNAFLFASEIHLIVRLFW